MADELKVVENSVEGEFALVMPPGIKRAERDRMITDAISGALADAARELGAVLAASPMAYTQTLPGVDSDGKTRLRVRARREGDFLVPARSKR